MTNPEPPTNEREEDDMRRLLITAVVSIALALGANAAKVNPPAEVK
jgi:hypothetical protein